MRPTQLLVSAPAREAEPPAAASPDTGAANGRFVKDVNEDGSDQGGEDGPTARHVAIISDGNGRWAQARGLSVSEGHEAAADTVIARAQDALELGIGELTVFSFSTENWTRPAEEVRRLISLLAQRVQRDTPKLHERDIRIRFIGRRQGIVAELAEQIAHAEALTATNESMTLFVAFNYGGRAEIIDAARGLRAGSEEDLRQHLYAPDMHDPDVVIRTGGERRLSNFLLWQCAYSELVFRDELWPDFSRENLESSLAQFSQRSRRFGGRT